MRPPSPIALGIVLYQGLPGARVNFIAVTSREKEREKQVVSVLSQPSPNLNTIRQETSHSWLTPKNTLFHVHGNRANLCLTAVLHPGILFREQHPCPQPGCKLGVGVGGQKAFLPLLTSTAAPHRSILKDGSFVLSDAFCPPPRFQVLTLLEKFLLSGVRCW